MNDIVLTCPARYPYDRLDLLLARVSRRGRFELLSAAWERVLGYGRAELQGLSLFMLIHLPPSCARRLVRVLLDERDACPLVFSLATKSGTRVSLQWYRRFDAYDEQVFIAGDRVRRH